MKVAIIIDTLNMGGAEWQALVAAAELGRLGVEAHLITYHAGNDFKDFVRDHQVRVTCLPRTGFLKWRRFWELARNLRKERFDVVHSFKGLANIYGTLAAILAGKRNTIGGYQGMHAMSFFEKWPNRLLGLYNRSWIVNSQAVKDTVCRDTGLPSAKVLIVPNGVYLEKLATGLNVDQARALFSLPTDKAVVTFIGRLHPHKNLPLFLQTARLLVDQGLNAVFCLGGDGPLRGELEARVGEMGLDQHVVFLGMCRQVPQLLRASDVFLLTSPSEGLSNALCEATGAGIPIVSTRHHGARAVIEDGCNGFIVDHEADALAAKVRLLVEDKELHARMSRAGKKLANERFAAAQYAQGLLAAYQAAAGRQSIASTATQASSE